MATDLEPLTALDETVQASILDFLASGNFLKVACEASGITYQGFRHWQRRWEEGDPGATRFDKFFRKVKQAVPMGEAAALARLRMGDPGWQAQAWFLERRFPQRWAAKERPKSGTGRADDVVKTVRDAFNEADQDA